MKNHYYLSIIDKFKRIIAEFKRIIQMLSQMSYRLGYWLGGSNNNRAKFCWILTGIWSIFVVFHGFGSPLFNSAVSDIFEQLKVLRQWILSEIEAGQKLQKTTGFFSGLYSYREQRRSTCNDNKLVHPGKNNPTDRKRACPCRQKNRSLEKFRVKSFQRSDL
ncbi:MAG: hypothetical protein UV40_C0015G0008 [Parcubacteria group bacterium GW2011_GWA1_42_7]|nr:MAG: hypothetical protein UV40_C0015G0008 [Parcubacteria group bacterium GW2011_GWA1_42_7]